MNWPKSPVSPVTQPVMKSTWLNRPLLYASFCEESRYSPSVIWEFGLYVFLSASASRESMARSCATVKAPNAFLASAMAAALSWTPMGPNPS